MDAGAFAYGRGMYEIESRPGIGPHGHRLMRCQRGALRSSAHMEIAPTPTTFEHTKMLPTTFTKTLKNITKKAPRICPSPQHTSFSFSFIR